MLKGCKGHSMNGSRELLHSDFINTSKQHLCFEMYTQGAREWLKALEAWKNKMQNKQTKQNKKNLKKQKEKEKNPTKKTPSKPCSPGISYILSEEF